MHVARCHDLPVYAPMLWISTAFLAGAMINSVQWWNKKMPTWLTVSVASRFAAIFGVKRSFSFYWLQQLISEPGLKCGKLAELFLLWLVRFHFQVGFGLVSGGFRVFPATETFELLFSRQMMQSAPDEGDQNILECIWSTQDLYCNVGSFKLIQGPLPVVGDLALVRWILGASIFKKAWQTCQILLLGISWDARSAVYAVIAAAEQTKPQFCAIACRAMKALQQRCGLLIALIAPSEGRPSWKNLKSISILRVHLNLEATVAPAAPAAPSPAPTAAWIVILLVCLIASLLHLGFAPKNHQQSTCRNCLPETWLKAEPADASDTADPAVPAAAASDPPEEAANEHEAEAAEGGLLGRLREKVAPTVQRVAEMESQT